MKYNGVTKYSWVYGANGKIGQHVDGVMNATWRYEYDLNGRTTRAYANNHVEWKFGYNTKGQLASSVFTLENMVRNLTYQYDAQGRINQINFPGGVDEAYTYPGLGRLYSSNFHYNGTCFLSSALLYAPGNTAGTTTNRISQYRLAGHNWQDFREYTYDANGNITNIAKVGGNSDSYSYDALNQLTDAVQNGNTYAYSHDNGGNILTKTTNGVTKHYSYTNANWKDQLTYYGSQSGSTTPNITYDAIGNPLTYYNGASFTWQGRQMQTAAYNGNNLEFRYNADGIRTRKIVNGAYTYYSVNGNNVVWQRTPNGIDAFFDYDAAGRAATMAYNGSTYYYVYNMQGDVIGLVDRNGDKMVEYTYDPYGKQLTCTGSLASTIGQINPFRYRGYVYDAETGLYYVSSRYYDPETCRWINADTTDVIEARQDELLGLNLFAYCDNNPVNYCDPTGEILISTCVLIGIGIGALIGGAAGGLYGYNQARKAGVPPKDRWKYVVGYGLGGAVIGGIIGGFMGYGIGFLCGATSTSGVALRAISKGLSDIAKRTWSHIITKGHAWNLVMKNVTQNGVKNIISQALKKGATTLIDKMVSKGVTSMIYETVYPYMGQKIIVHYAVIDGIIKISDAWVKTR